MALKYAVLSALLDGEASGYDLAKRFDVSVANVWHALPQQIYAELAAMERAGLVSGRTIVQESRPNKRLYSLSAEGRRDLAAWLTETPRASAVKDDMLVRCFAADVVAPAELIPGIKARRAQHMAKLEHYRTLRELLFKGRSEEEYLRTTRRVGPYLALRRGLAFEEENIVWCDWVVSVLTARGKQAGRGAAAAES